MYSAAPKMLRIKKKKEKETTTNVAKAITLYQMDEPEAFISFLFSFNFMSIARQLIVS